MNLSSRFFFRIIVFFLFSFSFFFAGPVVRDVFALSYDSSNCGQTIELDNGTYSELRVTASCSSSNPLIIRAKNDGQVTFDGQGNHVPVSISGASYVTVEGIVARDSDQSVFYITGNSDHITVRRTSAYDGVTSGNHHVWEIAYSDDIELEDCAGTGEGRYVFLFYDSQNVTCRRCWARWEHYVSGAPRAPYAIYGSKEVVLENSIGQGAIPNSSNDYYTDYTGVYIEWAGYNRFRPVNNVFRGSIIHNNFHAGVSGHSGDGNNHFYNSVIFGHPRLSCSGRGSNCPDYDRAYGVDMRVPDGTVRNCTFVNNNKALWRRASGTQVTNSSFTDNGTAMGGGYTDHAYCNFYNNDNNGATLVSTDLSADPNFDTSTYGQGAYFFIPPSSPLKNAGESGEDIGANILYQYENGTLTSKRLWPWPMEDRIKSETGISVTWAAGGGYWKTLDGVYDSSPSPKPTSTPTPPPISFKELLTNWGNDFSNPDADQNKDGLVNGIDFGIVLNF